MKDVKIVIGANFGDEGKGLMTDYFSKGANSVVVLSNGGSQRGHTVVRADGVRHVFHHFGSGTFNGAPTYFPKEFILNPLVFVKEYEELEKLGYHPETFGGAGCMVTTPWDMMANQVIEQSRGAGKHGSCGMGIYETIQREQSGIPCTDYTKIFKYYRLRFKELGIKFPTDMISLFLSPTIVEHYMADLLFMRRHIAEASDQYLDSFQRIIFENGQGLMLDQNNKSYFPHLTPSNTGIKNPLAIIERVKWSEPIDIEACYVTRTYLTRHGAGKLLGECKKEEINSEMLDGTNVPNPHQDSLRYGKLDVPSLCDRCFKDKQNVRASIAITHNIEYSLNENLMAQIKRIFERDIYLSDSPIGSSVKIVTRQ